MKNLVLILLAFFPILSFGQDQNWNQEQLQVLNEFNLDKNDHRGVIFTATSSQCDLSEENLEKGAIYFFKTDSKKDLIKICVAEIGSLYADRPMGLKEVIDLYLEQINK